jgi:broad specificity phosphatase PhoE
MKRSSAATTAAASSGVALGATISSSGRRLGTAAHTVTGILGAVIYLARHGQTDANAGGVFASGADQLTAAGRDQARALAREAEGLGLASLYASTLPRAQETAEIVGASVGLPVVGDPRLAEISAGRWTGRRRRDVKAAEPEVYRARRKDAENFRYPGGESLAEHQQRVGAALRDIAAGPLPALVVGHSGTIRSALTLGRPLGLHGWIDIAVPNATVFELPAACLAAIS